MPREATIITIMRIMFYTLGISTTVSGVIVFMVLPVAFVISFLTIFAGLYMILCGIRADKYVTRQYES